MKTFYIYRHTNLINGKVYIGQTCQKPEYRWGKDGNGYKNSPHFYSAIQQYGWNAFQHEILYSGLTQEEANKIETELILKYDSNNPSKGYNSETGGKNKTPNEETRLRQSIAAQNRPIVTEETKKKLSAISLGLKRSDETREKMRNAALEREKQRKGQKMIPVICKNTGKYFVSCREAANWCGLAGTSGISSVCKGGKQKTAGVHPDTKEKLTWKYATIEEIEAYEIRKNQKE